MPSVPGAIRMRGEGAIVMRKGAMAVFVRRTRRPCSVAVGELVAKRAIAKGIQQVVFDRGGNLYHGRIKALADAAREAGLQF